MRKVTVRQIEALAGAAVHGSPFRDYGGRYHTNMGGSIRRMIDDLAADGLLDEDRNLTTAGVARLEENLKRIPEATRDKVVDRLPALRRAAEEVERAHAERRAQARATASARAETRERELRAKIPAKFRELAERFGANIHAAPDEVIVEFWRAIVDADAAL